MTTALTLLGILAVYLLIGAMLAVATYPICELIDSDYDAAGAVIFWIMGWPLALFIAPFILLGIGTVWIIEHMQASKKKSVEAQKKENASG